MHEVWKPAGGFGFGLGCAVRGALDRVRMLVLLDHLDRARLALLRLDGPITVPEDTLLLRGRRGLTEKEHLEGARERTGPSWRVRAHRHGMIERVAHRRWLWVACGRKDPQ